jgi:hypothetical protein
VNGSRPASFWADAGTADDRANLIFTFICKTIRIWAKGKDYPRNFTITSQTALL